MVWSLQLRKNFLTYSQCSFTFTNITLSSLQRTELSKTQFIRRQAILPSGIQKTIPIHYLKMSTNFWSRSQNFTSSYASHFHYFFASHSMLRSNKNHPFARQLSLEERIRAKILAPFTFRREQVKFEKAKSESSAVTMQAILLVVGSWKNNTCWLKSTRLVRCACYYRRSRIGGKLNSYQWVSDDQFYLLEWKFATVEV